MSGQSEKGKKAHAVLVEYHTFIFRQAHRSISFPDLAEDVAQQVCADFLAKADRWDLEKDARPLLKKMVRYRALSAWRERVKLLPEPAPIFCIKGVGACPPEGCGGFSSFEDFCEVMANPKHPEYKEAKEWYGGKYDPRHFDLDSVNEELNVERSSTPAKKTKRKATKKKTTT